MKFERGKQPKCAACSHSKSFHGGDAEGECKAMGCKCDGWVEPEAPEEDSEVIEDADTTA